MAIDVRRIQPKALTSVEKQPLIPAAPGRAVEELIASVQGGLSELVELFNLSPAITGDDKTKLAGIIKAYSELVTENLGAAPGEPIKKENTEFKLDMLSPEAGVADVQLAF